MIDPGHGGRDPGAVANGLEEKTLVLTIARRIKQVLVEHYNVDVRMTRDDDRFVTLGQRAKLANDWGADYFLSIHINAGGGSGFESFIYTNTSAKTKSYQKVMHEEITGRLYGKDRGMKKANFAVLRKTNMPAILTENLFIDNAEDSRSLKDSTVIKAIAQGHVNGLMKLLKLSPKELKEPKSTNKSGSMYRVLIDDEQVGTFQKKSNIVSQVKKQIGKADRIEIVLV